VDGVVSASRIVLGTVQWGQRYGIAGEGAPDDAELVRLLERAHSVGIAALDTARAYGTSEARIGSLAAPRRFAIQTKLAPDVAPPGATAAVVRDRAVASLAASLTELRTARVDAVLLHRAAHRHAASGAAWEALRGARREGRIARIGLSAAQPEDAWAALADPEVERIQVATSLFDQRLWRAGFFERAHRAGKQVQVRSVFLQGVAFLAPEVLPEHLGPLRDPLHRIAAWANARSLTVADACLLFARAVSGVSLVLGFERSAHLDAALAAWCRPVLSSAEHAELAGLTPELGDDVLDPSHWTTARRSTEDPSATA
jgi:aryl-alcohol dehydrogenase-like predicted oxidoreductase